MSLKFFRLTDKNLSKWQPALEKLEAAFAYPLGDDEFRISHGNDYLGFFRRIGSPAVYAASHHSEIIAVGAGIISHRHKAWYLCDMKVMTSHRGNRLPRKFFTRYFLFNYLKCRRGFALNMESSDGKINPIQKIMQRLPWTPLKVGARVLFYYEDAAAVTKAHGILSSVRKDIHFSSVQSKKDLVLKSTGQGIPLLHMEWGKKRDDEENHTQPQEGKLHMWCLQDNHPLVSVLANEGIHAKASGLIFQHGMNGFDWNELRTSEL